MGAEWVVIYGVLGALVGFLAGLLGVGGGGLLVPLLAMMLRYQGMAAEHVVHYALGTAFACMIVSSAASIRAHARQRQVVWHVFFSMAAGILIGTYAMTRAAAQVHSGYIALFFAAFMALIAMQMFMNWKPAPSRRPTTFWGLGFAGIIIGSVSALAAVGGGFLTITYLTYKHLPMKRAIGTSAAIGLPIALAGTMGYALNGWQQTANDPRMWGFIYLPAFVMISLTSIIAAPAGARLAQRLEDVQLKRIFAIICVLLSVKMVMAVV